MKQLKQAKLHQKVRTHFLSSINNAKTQEEVVNLSSDLQHLLGIRKNVLGNLKGNLKGNLAAFSAFFCFQLYAAENKLSAKQMDNILSHLLVLKNKNSLLWGVAQVYARFYRFLIEATKDKRIREGLEGSESRIKIQKISQFTLVALAKIFDANNAGNAHQLMHTNLFSNGSWNIFKNKLYHDGFKAMVKNTLRVIKNNKDKDKELAKAYGDITDEQVESFVNKYFGYHSTEI